MAVERPDEADAAALVAELRAEIERLRSRVARLQSEKTALLAAQAARDFERPPHYQ